MCCSSNWSHFVLSITTFVCYCISDVYEYLYHENNWWFIFENRATPAYWFGSIYSVSQQIKIVLLKIRNNKLELLIDSSHLSNMPVENKCINGYCITLNWMLVKLFGIKYFTMFMFFRFFFKEKNEMWYGSSRERMGKALQNAI